MKAPLSFINAPATRVSCHLSRCRVSWTFSAVKAVGLTRNASTLLVECRLFIKRWSRMWSGVVCGYFVESPSRRLRQRNMESFVWKPRGFRSMPERSSARLTPWTSKRYVSKHRRTLHTSNLLVLQFWKSITPQCSDPKMKFVSADKSPSIRKWTLRFVCLERM